MKKILIAIVMSVFLTNIMAQESGHQHEGDHHSDTSLTLNDGKKWEVDQVMINNMLSIHDQFTKTVALIESNKITKKDFLALSDNISVATQDILINCKLEEKADENFHIILGELLTVADDLKDINRTKEAIKKLSESLTIYTEYFNQSF